MTSYPVHIVTYISINFYLAVSKCMLCFMRENNLCKNSCLTLTVFYYFIPKSTICFNVDGLFCRRRQFVAYIDIPFAWKTSFYIGIYCCRRKYKKPQWPWIWQSHPKNLSTLISSFKRSRIYWESFLCQTITEIFQMKFNSLA